MRKIRLIITLLISSTLITSGCGISSPNVKEEVNKQCEELMDCFGKDDTNGIKNLFCPVVSDSPNFDNNLLEAVEFFEGTVTSYDIKGIGSDQKTEHGAFMFHQKSGRLKHLQDKIIKSAIMLISSTQTIRNM